MKALQQLIWCRDSMTHDSLGGRVFCIEYTDSELRIRTAEVTLWNGDSDTLLESIARALPRIQKLHKEKHEFQT